MFTAVALGPEEICGILIGGGCGQYYDPWKQNWTVIFPDVPKPPPSNQSNIPKVRDVCVFPLMNSLLISYTA